MPSPEAVHKHAATLKQLVIDVYQDQVTDQLYYDETSLRKLTAGMRAMRQLALAVPAYYFRPNDISCQLTSAGWLESALYKHVDTLLRDTSPITLNILTLPTPEMYSTWNWRSPGSRAVLKVIATRIFETATAQPTNVLRTVALGSHHLTSNLSVSSNSVHFFVQGQVRVLGMMRKKLQTFQVSMEELRKERTGEVDALGLDLMYDVDQCVRLGAEDEDVHETEGVGEYDSESDE